MLAKKQYKQFTPIFAITSEYDAIIAIYNTYNLLIDHAYVTTLSIQHVKGHQDNGKNIKI